MAINYFFNIALSEADYPLLPAFEVSLRNSLPTTLADHFGSDSWFDDPRLFSQTLSPSPENWQCRTVSEAKQRLGHENKPPDADRIVAELHLGFWQNMLSRPFERLLWRPNKARLLKESIPEAPRHPSNHQIAWDRCGRIRIVRNRVMHYEPLRTRPHLAGEHSEMPNALGWISSDMQETVAMSDRFGVVHDAGRRSVGQRVRDEVQRRCPSPI